MKFYICHDSTGIVTCAKFCCDHTQTWILRSRAIFFCKVSIWDITILLVKRRPWCLPWSAWGTHDSTNFVNWAKASFKVTLVSDMEIVFGALVSLKSATRWFCLEDKLGQWETLHACSENVCLCLVLPCCLSRSWSPYWRTHSPIGANLQSVNIMLHGLIRESQ